IPEGSVALTFDDGPSSHSKEIADILTNYQAGGTFFFIGANVQKYPESVRYIYKKGYSIGTHSMHHEDVSQLSYDNQEKELLRARQLVEKITGEQSNLFRPPYGAQGKLTQHLMNEHNSKMVLWNK